MTADRPATEPRTEAEKALDRLDEIAPTLWQQQPKGHPMMPMQIIIREWVATIRSALAEAAQGAAPLTCSSCGVKVLASAHCHDCYWRMVERGDEGAAPRAEGLDVENVARVLHELGFVYWAGAADHPPFGECYCSDARREDARDFLARLSRPSDERTVCANCGATDDSHTEVCVHHPDVQARLKEARHE